MKLMKRSDGLRDDITIYHVMSQKSSKSHFLNMISDIDNMAEEWILKIYKYFSEDRMKRLNWLTEVCCSYQNLKAGGDFIV